MSMRWYVEQGVVYLQEVATSFRKEGRRDLGQSCDNYANHLRSGLAHQGEQALATLEHQSEQRNWRGVRWADSVRISSIAEEIAGHFGHDCGRCGENEDEKTCAFVWVESKLSSFLDWQREASGQPITLEQPSDVQRNALLGYLLGTIHQRMNEREPHCGAWDEQRLVVAEVIYKAISVTPSVRPVTLEQLSEQQEQHRRYWIGFADTLAEIHSLRTFIAEKNGIVPRLPSFLSKEYYARYSDPTPFVRPVTQHDGPCYEEGILGGLEFAAKLVDRFKEADLNLAPVAEEIRKLKCQVFPYDNLTGGPACEVIEPYPFHKPVRQITVTGNAEGETVDTGLVDPPPLAERESGGK